MSPTHQDLSNDITFSQIKYRVPVPLKKLTERCSNWIEIVYIAHTQSNHFDKPMREKKRQILIEKISCCCPFIRADHTI